MGTALPQISWNEAVAEFLLHLRATRAPKTVRFYDVQLRQRDGGKPGSPQRHGLRRSEAAADRIGRRAISDGPDVGGAPGLFQRDTQANGPLETVSPIRRNGSRGHPTSEGSNAARAGGIAVEKVTWRV